MDRGNGFTAGLIPLIAAAGLLSGTLLRPNAVPDRNLREQRPERARAEASSEIPDQPRLADLQPVLDLLGEAMGVSLEPSAARRAAQALRLDAKREGGVSSTKVRRALQDLEERYARSWSIKLSDDNSLAVVDSYLHSDADAGSRLHKLRSQVVDRLFDDIAAMESMRRLIAGLHADNVHWNVRFLVATVPDYVDSNSGWVADETIGAIQSAMSNAGFVLDRFRLIDWSRADDDRAGKFANSRLHERQPGALIFRRVPGDDSGAIDLEIVLLVLETPTAGVHRTALRNAIRFVHGWQTAAEVGPGSSVRLIAPVFSGSVPSLALELNDLQALSSRISVVTGSAMANVNQRIMERFAPGVSYQAAAPRTSDVTTALANSLTRMNPRWDKGRGVALLIEANTSFGNSVMDRPEDAAEPRKEPASFEKAFVYRFPLHVAQLRSDATAAPTVAMPLLPAPIVPLNFREALPPADQLPALRPQLTSPVVEATVSNLLDNIRHEGISAVGIIATDSRDVLFLAREVKKSAPDVQLFLAGGYLLYLHPDYIPYTRGALVASPYPLALMSQRRIHDIGQVERETLPSMIAAGVFNATLMQLGRYDRLMDYCDPEMNAAEESRRTTFNCRPPVWISVIGHDGYWPISREANNSPLVKSFTDLPESFHRVPLSAQARMVVVAIGLTIAALLWVVALVRTYAGRFDRRFSGIPLLRVVAPPITYGTVAAMHSNRVVLIGVVLASAASWVATVAFMHFTAQPGGSTSMAAVVAATVFAVIVTASVMLARGRGTYEIPLLPNDDDSPRAPQRTMNVAVMRACLYLLLGVILSFLVFVSRLIWSSDSIEAPFAVSRFVGGGIVSPAAAILCLFGAMLTGMLAGLRRLSLVGNGYTALAHGSPAFRLLSGAPGRAPGSALSTKPTEMDNENRDLQHFVSVLDMPMQNMSQQYVICVVALVATAASSVGRISTIDGVWFSMFVTCASWWVLLTALLLLVQGGVTWRVLRPKLARLSQTRLAKPLGRVGRIVRWDLSMAPPRLCELVPLAQRGERIRGSVFLVANKLGALLDDPQPVDQLRHEINERKSSPLMASATWHTLWRMSNRMVSLLESEHWSRRGYAEQQAIVASVRPDAKAHEPRPADRPSALELWLGQCEEFVALQFVFVLRDVLARIMSSLFAAMVCLTLLTAAHLFYLFQGRASMLTADLIAIVVTAVVAIRIVVGIERDVILSKLRHTTPGRINFSWDFVRQVATYGLLPLIAVIASLFPEVSGSLFSWLEPLRKLAAP